MQRFEIHQIPYVFGLQCSTALDWNPDGKGRLLAAGGPDEFRYSGISWVKAIRIWDWFGLSRQTDVAERLARLLLRTSVVKHIAGESLGIIEIESPRHNLYLAGC